MAQHFDHSFAASAPENYERYFVAAIGRPVAEKLIQLAELQPGDRVLDVACGTGVVARLSAEQVGPTGAVAGLDINPGMLAVARAVAPPELGIEWHEASAESMPLPDEAFDVVLCQMGLQFMSDRLQALREMRRVLRPGGRVAFNVPGPIAPLFQILADALGRHVGPQAAGFVQAVFALHDEGEIERLLTDAGFDAVRVQARSGELLLPPPGAFLAQYTSGTPLSAVLAGADEEVRSALEREVVSAWQQFRDGDGMRFSQRVVAATGRRPHAADAR